VLLGLALAVFLLNTWLLLVAVAVAAVFMDTLVAAAVAVVSEPMLLVKTLVGVPLLKVPLLQMLV
jgi:hypothetical protein